jgi:hypothetical protein
VSGRGGYCFQVMGASGEVYILIEADSLCAFLCRFSTCSTPLPPVRERLYWEWGPHNSLAKIDRAAGRMQREQEYFGVLSGT